MQFELYPLRLAFRARDPLYFPPHKSGNILRGTFGAILKRVACPPACQSAKTCELRNTCQYARIFEPHSEPDSNPAPSGLADPPRPFVFRAAHLDGRSIAPGETFHFDLHLFDTRDPGLPSFVFAFARLGEQGLGPQRGRADLLTVTANDAQPVYANGKFSTQPLQSLKLSLVPEACEVQRIRVRFLTPTELKSGQGIAAKPEFGVLFSRARDRVSTLRRVYGQGVLDIDYREMGTRAASVAMTSCTLQRIEAERRSGSTGQTHSLGGFIGEAEYEGDLRDFLPYLKAAKWTGVGRQTVWGKGEIEVTKL